jgi:hypothetical protein
MNVAGAFCRCRMWTDVFSVIESRTTGTKAGTYATVSPAGRGRCRAPTLTIWILGLNHP